VLDALSILNHLFILLMVLEVGLVFILALIYIEAIQLPQLIGGAVLDQKYLMVSNFLVKFPMAIDAHILHTGDTVHICMQEGAFLADTDQVG
jgi:riboflavin transporter FmnP